MNVEESVAFKLEADLLSLLLTANIKRTYTRSVAGTWVDTYKQRDEQGLDPFLKINDFEIETLKNIYKIQIGVSVLGTPILFQVKDDHNIVQLTQPSFLISLLRLNFVNPALKDKEDVTRVMEFTLMQQPKDILTLMSLVAPLDIKEPLKSGDVIPVELPNGKFRLTYELERKHLLSRVCLTDIETGTIVAAWLLPMLVPSLVLPNVFSME